MMIFDPMNFDAVGDGSADDAPAFRSAVDAAVAVGGRVIIPPGLYAFHTLGPTVTGRCSVEGMGWKGAFSPIDSRGSYILPDAGVIAFDIRSDDAVDLSNFAIVYDNGSTVPAISLTGSKVWNNYSKISDIHIRFAKIGIKTTTAVTYNFNRCLFEGCAESGIWAQDVLTPGNGDSVIESCTFSGCPSKAHVYATSGGGLRIINNKLNGAGTRGAGIWVHLTERTEGFSPFIIGHNSIEGMHDGILFDRITGTLAGACIIDANEIAHVWCGINLQADSPWINGLSVTGNQVWGSAMNGPCTNIYVDGVLQAGLVNDNLLMANVGQVNGIIQGPHNQNLLIWANQKGPNVI